MRSYPGFCRRKQLEYNPGLTHRRRAGHPRANRRTSDRPSFCGVRPSCSRVIMSCHIFQSTHPLRGATTREEAEKALQEMISIHAPLAGCDSAQAVGKWERGISIHAPLAGCDTQADGTLSYWYLISIHAPLAGCDQLNGRGIMTADISIHAPLAGCDDNKALHQLATSVISIHAPLAGCDTPTAFARRSSLYFNPRTPCGVPLVSRLQCLQYRGFQSTHPLRGATPNTESSHDP